MKKKWKKDTKERNAAIRSYQKRIQVLYKELDWLNRENGRLSQEARIFDAYICYYKAQGDYENFRTHYHDMKVPGADPTTYFVQ